MLCTILDQRYLFKIWELMPNSSKVAKLIETVKTLTFAAMATIIELTTQLTKGFTRVTNRLVIMKHVRVIHYRI